MPLNFEVGISDTDGPEPAQEKMMTILTTPWAHVRNRLMVAALAPSDGKAARRGPRHGPGQRGETCA